MTAEVAWKFDESTLSAPAFRSLYKYKMASPFACMTIQIKQTIIEVFRSYDCGMKYRTKKSNIDLTALELWWAKMSYEAHIKNVLMTLS